MEPGGILVGVVVLSLALIALLILKPEITLSLAGKMFAFLALFIFPILAALMGTHTHIEHSKTTKFCLSCHEMEPYGKSLHIDDSEYIPAQHFQNHRVDSDHACFTCHTNYTMFGDIKAKMEGLHHVYVHYLGTPAQPIKLYEPYNNRECLHCHAGARTFEEGATHNEEPDRLAKIKANQLSCMSSGCHEHTHSVAKLNELSFWEEKK